MSESSAMPAAAPAESSAMPPAARRSRRRRVIICASFVVLVLLLLAATAAIVLLAVLRPRDPTTELLSANATGAAPRVTFPTVSVQLNVTFLLVVRVRNPNPASFRYGEAATTLLYRGAPVGSAVVPAGTVPSRGATTMRLGMTLQADKVVAAAGIGGLLGDVLAGEIEFESRTDVKGRVTFLGFVKRSAQAKTVCRIAIGVPDVKVRRQDCHNEARL